MGWIEAHWQVLTILGAIVFHFGQSSRQSSALKERVETGFKGTHERLDKVNDKIYDHEGRLGALET